MRQCAPSLPDALGQLLEKLLVLFNTARGAHQRLTDDMFWLHDRSKFLGGHRRNSSPPFVVGTCTCKRCRGADALQFTGGQPILHAPHQQGNVSSLASPVGMQFIQHQKLQCF